MFKVMGLGCVLLFIACGGDGDNGVNCAGSRVSVILDGAEINSGSCSQEPSTKKAPD